MGGRGSGGGRGGGGGAAGKTNSDMNLLSDETIGKFSINNFGFINDIKTKLSNMSDFQLDQQYSVTKKQLKKAEKEYRKERDKFNVKRQEFDKTTEGTKEYSQKMKEMDSQLRNLQLSQQWLNMREQAHYIVVNEKFNVRGKKK